MKIAMIIMLMILITDIFWIVSEVIRMERERKYKDMRCINCIHFNDFKKHNTGVCEVDEELKDYRTKACINFEEDKEDE